MSKDETRPTRTISRHECTANPIFLFQRRCVSWTEGNPYRYDADSEGLFDSDGVEVDDDRGLSEGYAFEYWITDLVFFRREEAEQWGKDHNYNYPGGWRSYSVPSKGDLVGLLAGLSKRADCQRSKTK